MMEVIVRNSGTCLACNTSIESRHRHDYSTCPCGNASVDGGHDYLKRAVEKPGTFRDTSIIGEEESRVHTLEHTDIRLTVHHSMYCEGRPCTIHNRTGHPLRWMAQSFNPATGAITRVCLHGNHHPDPDSPPWHAQTEPHRCACRCCGATTDA